MAITSKELRKQAKEAGLNLQGLFPKSKIRSNKKFTPYQARKIKKELKRVNSIPGRFALYPDRPDHYERAGFESNGTKHTHVSTWEDAKGNKHKRESYWWSGGKIIYPSGKRIQITETYKSEGESSFYRAVFFGGVINVQMIPIIHLPVFLEKQIKLDDENGQFYDKITLREGDRGMWGQEAGLEKMWDSAEELYLSLIQYKRHGSLIGEGGSFTYIQVCFINLEY